MIFDMCAAPKEFKDKGMLRYLVVSVLIPVGTWVVISTWSVSKRDSDITGNSKAIESMSKAVEKSVEAQAADQKTLIEVTIKQGMIQEDLEEISRDVKTLIKNQ